MDVELSSGSSTKANIIHSIVGVYTTANFASLVEHPQWTEKLMIGTQTCCKIFNTYVSILKALFPLLGASTLANPHIAMRASIIDESYTE